MKHILLAAFVFAAVLPSTLSAQSTTAEVCFTLEEEIRTLQAEAKALAATLDQTVQNHREAGDDTAAAAAIVKARTAARAVDDALFSYASRCEEVLSQVAITETNVSDLESKVSLLKAQVERPSPFDKLANLQNSYRLAAYQKALAEAEAAATREVPERNVFDQGNSLRLDQLFLPLGQIILPGLTRDDLTEEESEENDLSKELELPLDEDFDRIEGQQGKQHRDSFEQLMEEEEESEGGFWGGIRSWLQGLFGGADSEESTETSATTEPVAPEVAESDITATASCQLSDSLLDQLYPPDVYTVSETENDISFIRQSCRSKSAAALREETEAYALGAIQEVCTSARIKEIRFTASSEPCGVVYEW